MTQFFWDTPPPKGRREVLNPRPIVPETGWKRPTSFPDLSSASAIGFDVETKDKNLRIHGAGWGRGDGHIVGLAISTDDGFSGYYPVRHEDEPEANFDPATVFRWAREQLSRPYQTKVGHNITYDIGWLKAEGVPVIGPLWDTWVAEKLLRFRNEASLEATGQRRVGEGKQSTLLLRWLHQYYGRGRTPEDDDLDESQKGNLYRAPARLVGPYGESDVILPLKVGLVQGPLLEELGMMELFEMECELIRLFVEMRWKGVRVDIPAAEAADHKLGQELEVLSKEIWHIGGRLNPNSGEEVGRALQKLGFKVPITPRTKKFSVTDDLLSKIDHPFAEKVSEWRELHKFQSTFIRGAILEANVKGVVHGTLNQLRAITGRMSCSDPNLQNIPSRNEALMQVVRGIFVPWEGHAYWRKDDYSSIESRLLAHFATGGNSEELREEYRNNPDTDYHNFTTAMVKKETGLDLPRKHIKVVNFSLVYGSGESKLSKTLKLSKEEAAPFFEAYHSGMPYVRDTMDSISLSTTQRGYTQTIMGRRVDFDLWEPKYKSKDDKRPALQFAAAVAAFGPQLQRAYLHKALNYTIQGSAADLMKKAMLDCWKAGVYDVTGVPLLIVHDEKDFSASEDSKAMDEAFREMKHIMETAIKFKVPIKVEGERGPNWGHLSKITAPL